MLVISSNRWLEAASQFGRRIVLMSVVIWMSCLSRTTLAADSADVLRLENQVAWCIVPFDAKKRGPAERAQMLQELGIRRCAYDWRAEHVPTFEQEILEYKKRNIEFFAFWGVHDEAFKLFEKYELHPQIWQMMNAPTGETQAAKVEAAAQQMLPLAKRVKTLGCKLGLYNHGGWSGEPRNMAAVCARLRELEQAHVGIVYNLHHAHAHIDDWAESFALIQPYLLCLNLNGMNRQEKPKILGIGKGEHELEMIRVVVAAGYQGPIGIICHRAELDARDALLENREGLAAIQKQLAKPSGDGPKPATQTDETPPAKTERVPPEPPAVPKTSQSKPPNELQPKSAEELPYDATLVERLIADSQSQGDAFRGARVFADAKFACISCHKVGKLGGAVGPELSAIAGQAPLKHIVESVLWPKREVKPEYVSWQIETSKGKALVGYKQAADERTLTLRDPAAGKTITLDKAEIESETAIGTVMPNGLISAMSRAQQLDLLRFLGELGRNRAPLSSELEQAIAHAQTHAATTFPITAAPLRPSSWPNADHPVNRDRQYDFYVKQAEYFRARHTPPLLAPYPGLDSGKYGHWGNQNEKTWADARWSESDLGDIQAGVFRVGNTTVARGICLRLGDPGELSVCFNPETLTYAAAWTGGFVRVDSVRHGFMSGLKPVGTPVELPQQTPPEQPFLYRGFYRYQNRIVFTYRIGEVDYLESPWVKDGKLVRDAAPAAQHPLRDALKGGPAHWPQTLETKIIPGEARPYAVDTIEMPFDNPWKALLFCGGHDFLPDGSALICTMQGDVWRVSGLDSGVKQPGVARWKRFASGLHHPLGLVVSEGRIYLQCRDQLLRLTDLNDDGEADFFECFSNAFQTSPAGHDYICGLERDPQGNFYTASGNQGLVRISADGRKADVIATGFRNPDGLGLMPDGTLTVPVSEGDWTSATAINAVRRNAESAANAPPHFGYRGPQKGKPPELPLAYLPRGLDNSGGGQTFVNGDRFGPLKQQLLHFSFGAGTWFVVLRDEVDGQLQGAVVPMTGDFRSGAHRARLNPVDGALYVSGMSGWGSYTPDDGCFQRVRYTGDPAQIPVGFHVHENGVRVTFSLPIDATVAADTKRHFAQCWNYRYSGAYGSQEYSAAHPNVVGHDILDIAGAHLLEDGRSLFLEIPDLQPVNQLHLRLHVNSDDTLTCSPAGTGHDLFVTAHRLDRPFTAFPGYKPQPKTIAVHPLLRDLAQNAAREPNPWAKPLAQASAVKIDTGKNLTFETNQLTVKAGKPIALTLENLDVVPHNWVLVRSGALREVGELGNQMIAKPDAFARNYVPDSPAVLAHTDIVEPGKKQTIYFQAPATPGKYPYLCTFPGHWMVMNGVMVVE